MKERLTDQTLSLLLLNKSSLSGKGKAPILTQKLKIIDKAWLCINKLLISNKDIEILHKSFGDKLKSLKVNKLKNFKGYYEEISYEAVEALNLINPCTSSFENWIDHMILLKCFLAWILKISKLNSKIIRWNHIY